jgi:hypothetical protein
VCACAFGCACVYLSMCAYVGTGNLRTVALDVIWLICLMDTLALPCWVHQVTHKQRCAPDA